MATVQYSIITTEESMKPGTIQVQNKSNRYFFIRDVDRNRHTRLTDLLLVPLRIQL